MSTIKWIQGVQIKLYAGDHPPPHLHIRAPGFDCVIELRTLKIRVRGQKTCDANNAIDWVVEHQDKLLKMWEKVNG